MFDKFPGNQAIIPWERLSQRFAENASGAVNAFVEGSRPSSVYNRIEYPTLLKNPNVSEIIFSLRSSIRLLSNLGDKSMLKKINEGRVESDSGFAIHIVGLETLKYEEGNRFVILEWNYDPKTQKIYVYASDVNNWKQPSNVRFTKLEKNKMINDIKDAVKLLKGIYEVL